VGLEGFVINGGRQLTRTVFRKKC